MTDKPKSIGTKIKYKKLQNEKVPVIRISLAEIEGETNLGYEGDTENSAREETPKSHLPYTTFRNAPEDVSSSESDNSSEKEGDDFHESINETCSIVVQKNRSGSIQLKDIVKEGSLNGSKNNTNGEKAIAHAETSGIPGLKEDSEAKHDRIQEWIDDSWVLFDI